MLLLACFALAQSTLDDDAEPLDPVESPVVYAPVTEHVFDGVKVDGAVQRPSGIVVFERRQAQFNPLIVVRAHWRAEIAASVTEAQ